MAALERSGARRAVTLLRACCGLWLLRACEACAAEPLGDARRLDASVLVQGHLTVHARKGGAKDEDSASAERPLPGGWASAIDPKTGEEYFWPASDRFAVTWERPTEPVAGQAAASSDAPEDGLFEDAGDEPEEEPEVLVQPPSQAKPEAHIAASLIATPHPGIRPLDVEDSSPQDQAPSGDKPVKVRCGDRLKAAQEELEEKKVQLKRAANEKLAFSQLLQSRTKANDARHKECLNELSALHTDLAQWRSDQAAAAGKAVICEEELKSAKDSRGLLEGLRERLRGEQEAAGNLTAACEARSSDLEARLRRSEDSAAADARKCQEALSERRSLQEASEGKVADLVKQVKQHEEDAEKQTAKCEEDVAHQRDLMMERTAALEKRIRKHEEYEESTSEKLLRCEADLESQKVKREDAETRASELSTRAGNLTAQQELAATRAMQCQADLKERSGRVSELESRVTVAEADVQQHKNRTSELEESLKVAKADLEKHRSQAEDLEKRLKASELHGSELTERLEHQEESSRSSQKEKRAEQEAGTTRFYHRKWLEAEERVKVAEDRAKALEKQIQRLEDKRPDLTGPRPHLHQEELEDVVRGRVKDLEAELEKQRGINAEHMRRWEASEAGEEVEVLKKDGASWSRGTIIGAGQKPHAYDVSFPSVGGGTKVVKDIQEAVIRKAAALPTFKDLQAVEVRQQNGRGAGKWSKATVLGHGDRPNTYDLRVAAATPAGYKIVQGVHASVIRADAAGPAGARSSPQAPEPQAQPSAQPSAQPAPQPSAQPAPQPSPRPSQQPAAQPSPRPSSQPRLKPGWRAIWSEADHDTYYWNFETGETTWDAPVLEEVAAH